MVSTPGHRAALELSLGAPWSWSPSSTRSSARSSPGCWCATRSPARRFVNSFIDLPFALPTIVAGLTLLALYGPKSPFGINLAYTRAAVVLALLFVTLPFVVRSVQPVLMELERDAEEAARSLGAGSFTVFRRIVLPSLLPAIISGAGLAFARALGEFGSVVLISGNIPFKTQIAPVRIFGLVESGDSDGAAAVSVVLLLISFAVLLILTLVQAWGRRADELD